MNATISLGVRKLRSSVVFSLLFHVLFGVACYVLNQQQRLRPSARQITWIQVEPVTPKKTTEAKEQDSLQKKVVQSTAGQEAKKASPDAFLGEKTRIVDRQTVSEKKLTVMGKKAAATPAAKTLAKREAESKRQAEPMNEPRSKSAANPLAQFGLPILPEMRRPGIHQEARRDEPQWANVGVQPQDYVDGVKQSDRTALNTREYAFYGYHQRIRQRLEEEWSHLLKETLKKFYRGGRQLASESEYVTKVLVVLNDRGEITKVKIVGMSGTQELDNVAVEAFNRAGPFPNPPRGLIKNGEIEVPWELRLRS